MATLTNRRAQTLKRLRFLVALLVLSAPTIALAQNQDGQGQNGPGGHRKLGATEMAAAGTGAAFLIGAAGYLLLRRKKSA
jgi:hypothetical protein